MKAVKVPFAGKHFERLRIYEGPVTTANNTVYKRTIVHRPQVDSRKGCEYYGNARLCEWK
jgi:hypothetical protein